MVNLYHNSSLERGVFKCWVLECFCVECHVLEFLTVEFLSMEFLIVEYLSVECLAWPRPLQMLSMLMAHKTNESPQ